MRSPCLEREEGKNALLTEVKSLTGLPCRMSTESWNVLTPFPTPCLQILQLVLKSGVILDLPTSCMEAPLLFNERQTAITRR